MWEAASTVHLSVCFTSVSIGVSGGGAKIVFIRRRFIFYLNINFIHRSQCHFNWLCINVYFSMLSHDYIVFWSLCSVMLSSYCSRAPRRASKWEAEEGLTSVFPCCFCVIAALISYQQNCDDFDFRHGFDRNLRVAWETNLYSIFQRLLVWCFTLVLQNHNHQPKQPQVQDCSA